MTEDAITGPTCDICGSKPSQLEEIKSPSTVDFGQFQGYHCKACGSDFTALRRYFYDSEGNQIKSPGGEE